MNDSGPFRYFWANVVRKPCAECQHPTAVGFDRHDPGESTREPTRCVLCVKAEVDNAIQFARGEIGYPLTEQGPCARAECRKPHHLYGPNGHPLCPECREAEPDKKAAKEHQPSRKSHQVVIPAPRESEREKEPSLF
jgi:hypothetical protein